MLLLHPLYVHSGHTRGPTKPLPPPVSLPQGWMTCHLGHYGTTQVSRQARQGQLKVTESTEEAQLGWRTMLLL